MHGNVWEWCADDWHENYEGAPTDGSAWMEFETSYLVKKRQNKSYLVIKGGYWSDDPDFCRSAIRDVSIGGRGGCDSDNGFRVVCLFERNL